MKHAITKKTGTGEIQIYVGISFHSIKMFQIIFLFSWMSRNKDQMRMAGNHSVHLPLLIRHGMIAQNHVILFGERKNFIQLSGTII